MRTAVVVCAGAWLLSAVLGYWLAGHDVIAVALLRRDPVAAAPLLALLVIRSFAVLVAPGWLAWTLIAWSWARRTSRG